MKKIIALKGAGGRGKTTTLKNLIALLDPTFDVKSYGDIRYATIIDGTKVGIATGGDNKNVILENIDFFNREICDICITACRTRGGTNNALNEYANANDTKVEYVRKAIEFDVSKQCSINEEQAKSLYDKIRKYI